MALYSLGKEVVEGIVVMKKIKYILCACLMMASLGMEAKSMKDLLVSMPDSVVPYLNHNLRLEFTELQEMGVKAEVKNLLEEVSVMDTLTQDQGFYLADEEVACGKRRFAALRGEDFCRSREGERTLSL